MNARSPNAYVFSMLLHGAIAALIILLGYLANEPAREAPKIFELVAGAGDNYGATVAPALGVPGGAKLVTAPPTPPVPPAPVAPAPPEAAPVQAAPRPIPTPPAPKAQPAPPKSDQVPNFNKQVQKTASRKEARLEAKYKKDLEKEQKRMSYEEYLKEHGGKTAAAAGPASKTAKIDAEGIRAGVVGGSTANKTGGAGGKALSREQQDLLDSYFAMLRAKLKDNFVPSPNVSDKLSAGVEFFLAADGSLSRVRIVRSSGSPEFDRLVLDAFAQTHMPPRPDGHGDTIKLTYSLRDEEPGP